MLLASAAILQIGFFGTVENRGVQEARSFQEGANRVYQTKRVLFRGFLAFVATIAMLGGAAWAVVDPGQHHEKSLDGPRANPQLKPIAPGDSGAAATAARAARVNDGGTWQFFSDQRSGRMSLAIGSGTPLFPGRGNDLEASQRNGLLDAHGEIDIEALRPSVDAFLARHPELAPPAGELVLDADLSSSREGGRLVSVYYRWEVGGVPVDGGHVFLKINSGNVTIYGAERIDTIELDPQPRLAAQEAWANLLAYAGHEELGRPQEEPRLLIQPEDDGGKYAYRLVWEWTYTVPGHFETWQGRVDAHSGDVVRFIDSNHYTRATGGIYPRSVLFDDETLAPMPEMNVTVGSNTVVTSPSGDFAYAGEGSNSTMSGPFFDVSCVDCTNPEQPMAGATVGSGRVDFGFGGNDFVGNGLSTQSDRNTWYFANLARSVALKWLPAEPWFQTANFTINTNIDFPCNAFYNSASINFAEQAADCNNTGVVNDVTLHEYGHGIDLNTNPGDGGTGEGTADAVSINITLDSQIGPGFRLSGAPVRDTDRTVSSLGTHTLTQANNICGSSPHCRGQVYGQSVWDLALALVARHGYYTGWRTSERLFFTSLPDAGSLEPSDSQPIYLAYMNADDDDGNLANGTPNGDLIFAAFDTHEIATIPYGASTGCSRPAQPTLSVQSSCDQFDLSWNDVGAATGYEIFRSELTAQRAYLPVASLPAGTTSWTDTDVMPGIDYHYQIMTVDAAGCESTVENPQFGRLTAQPILSVQSVVVDDIPRGNRSGFPDPDEEVDVRLVVENFGEIGADGLTGTVIPLSAGVTMLENSPIWTALAAGSSAQGQGTIRFITDRTQVACGDELQFQYLPSDTNGCAADTNYFTVTLGEPDGQGGFVCDPTPACFVEPTFAGLDDAQPGASCAETALSWGDAGSNCINAEISYNVYRSTDPNFVPDASTLVANVTGTSFQDQLLQPGETYYYTVRADDTRSGEDSNELKRQVVSPVGPDLAPPIFSGLGTIQGGGSCGEIELVWPAGQETCSGPVAYEIYRSTDPAFVPGPGNLVGSSLSTQFTDAALQPGVDYTYVVRARDGEGNESTTDMRMTVDATALDQPIFFSPFELNGEGFTVTAPNDAVRGNWEWGDPEPSASQPGDDFTADGSRAWFTGPQATAADGNNNDIDDGTTTLQSRIYNTATYVDPEFRFWLWYSNAQGAAPGEDVFIAELSNDDGATWVEAFRTSDDPQQWVQVSLRIADFVTPTATTRIRFQASDLGAGSLVDAGVDDFELIDRGQGCNACSGVVGTVTTIRAAAAGDDVVLEWTGDPAAAEATRFIVYKLSGPDFSSATPIGTTSTTTFVHQNASRSNEDFYYRVSIVDACGNEGALN